MSAVASYFPVNRWICANKSLTLGEFDSVLPQLDKHPEQREQLLQAKRQDYVFKEKIIGAPPQVCLTLPYHRVLGSEIQGLIFTTKIMNLVLKLVPASGQYRPNIV